MLPKKHRLPGNRIPQVATTKAHHYPGFSLKFLATQSDQPSRMAIIIPNRIYPLATDRHRLKRQLRHLLTVYLPQLRPGYDLLLIARPAIKTFKYCQLADELDQALHQAKLLNEKNSS